MNIRRERGVRRCRDRGGDRGLRLQVGSSPTGRCTGACRNDHRVQHVLDFDHRTRSGDYRIRTASSRCASSIRCRSWPWLRSFAACRPPMRRMIWPKRSRSSWANRRSPSSGPGSLVNRRSAADNQRGFLRARGGDASATEIEKGMILGCNHPMGPLALADLIGLDILLALMRTIHDEFGDSKYRPRSLPSQRDGRRAASAIKP
jgi:3-hydroxyacyl-CoA dehydrogenase, C-terminal domain